MHMYSRDQFFHGEHQPKRIVSHRSKREPNSNASTKESLLAYAQKERQERQLIQHQKHASIIFQLYIRRYLAKKIFSEKCLEMLEYIAVKSHDHWNRAILLFFWIKAFYTSDKRVLKHVNSVVLKALVTALPIIDIDSELFISSTVSFMEYCANTWRQYDEDMKRLFLEFSRGIVQKSSSLQHAILQSKALCFTCQYNGLEYQNWYINDLLALMFCSIKSKDLKVSFRLLLNRFHLSAFQSEETFKNCIYNNHIVGFYSKLLCSYIKNQENDLDQLGSVESCRLSLILFHLFHHDYLPNDAVNFVLEWQLSLLYAFKDVHGGSKCHLDHLHKLLGKNFMTICKIIDLYVDSRNNVSLLKFLLCIYFVIEKHVAIEYITIILMMNTKQQLPLIITWCIDSMNDGDSVPVALFLCILLQQYLIIATDSEVHEKLGPFLNFFCIYSRDKIIELTEESYTSYNWFNLIRVIDVISIKSQFLWKIYFVNQRIQLLSSNYYWTQPSSLLSKYVGIVKDTLFQTPLLIELEQYVTFILDHGDSSEISLGKHIKDDKRLKELLMILLFIPFAIPFDLRAHIIQKFIQQDKNRHSSSRDWFNPPLSVNIRRGFEFEDGYKKLFRIGLHGRIQITFMDELGTTESGVDGGSLFKEFVSRVFQTVFGQDFGLFRAVGHDNSLCPVCNVSTIEPTSVFHYEFVGNLVGKALYEDILLDARFSLLFLKKCRGFNGSLEDLRLLDQELYKNLLFLKDCSHIESLGLTFSNCIQGDKDVRELIPNGRDIIVTNESRFKYIYVLAHDILNTQLEIQTRAFMRGFHELIQPIWMRLFAPDEIKVLISGTQKDIDWKDWRNNTVYNGYSADRDSVISSFWSVVKDLSQEDKSLLLLFSTGCSRPPLFGFQELHPNFCISRSIITENADQRLPTVSACNNMLHLPNYSNNIVLKEKLLYAIRSNTGFYLA